MTVEGRDNRNHDDISGTYPVIGTWRSAGLITGTDSGPRSLCTGGNCDWYASHAALERGEAQRTTTTRIQAPLLSVTAILRTVEPKIRFYCLDAPEMQQAPWGRESRDHLRALVPRRFHLIEHTTDRYGRTVGELMSADSSINLAMVQAGTAAVYPKYCSERRFFAAQQAAKIAAAGIWSRSGLHQRPWDYRH